MTTIHHPPDRWRQADTGASEHPIDVLISLLISEETNARISESPRLQRHLLSILDPSDHRHVLSLSDHYIAIRSEETRTAYNLGHAHGLLHVHSTTSDPPDPDDIAKDFTEDLHAAIQRASFGGTAAGDRCGGLEGGDRGPFASGRVRKRRRDLRWSGLGPVSQESTESKIPF